MAKQSDIVPTISYIVEEWFSFQSFFPIKEQKDYLKYAEDMSNKVAESSKSFISLDCVTGNMKESILDMIRTLSVLADNHYKHNMKEKAASALRKSSMLMAMVPKYDDDLPRIDADLQSAVVLARLMKDSPVEQTTKLTENAHAYQKKGVNHYLLMLYHFTLIVGYLKAGNSAQFYNRCKILRDVLNRNFQLSLISDPESILISQVISMKSIKMPMSSEIYCGIVCFATLFEWLNRIMVDENSPKGTKLMQNAKKLAEFCGSDMSNRVNQIVELVESKIKKEDESFDPKLVPNRGNKIFKRSYSISIQDYDSARYIKQNGRPISSSKFSVHMRSKSGISPAPESLVKEKLVFVPGLNLEESTALGENSTRAKDSRTPEVSTYRLRQSGKFAKKEINQIRSHTARIQSLHSVIFEIGDSLVKKAELAALDEERKKPEIPVFTENYIDYSQTIAEKKAAKFELSTAAKGISNIRAKSKNISRKIMPASVKSNKNVPATIYGSYYLGLHTLQKHTEIPLQMTKNQSELEEELIVFPTKANHKPLNNIAPPDIPKSEALYLSRTNSTIARRHIKSRQSFNIGRHDDTATDGGLLSTARVESMMARRPVDAQMAGGLPVAVSGCLDGHASGVMAKKSKPAVEGINLFREDITNENVNETARERAEKRANERIKLKSRSPLTFNRENTDHQNDRYLDNSAKNSFIKLSVKRDKRINLAESTYKVSLDKVKRVKQRSSLQPFLTLRSNSSHPKNVENKLSEKLDNSNIALKNNSLVVGMNTEDDLCKVEKKEQTSALINLERSRTLTKVQDKLETYNLVRDLPVNFKSQQDVLFKDSEQPSNHVSPDKEHNLSRSGPESGSKRYKKLTFQEVQSQAIKLSEATASKADKKRRNSKLKIAGLAAFAATPATNKHRHLSATPKIEPSFSGISDFDRTNSIRQPNRRQVDHMPIAAVDEHSSISDKDISHALHEEANKSLLGLPQRNIIQKDESASREIRSSESFVQENIIENIDEAENMESPENLMWGQQREEIFTQIKNFNQSYNVKEDLLKFVQGFHKLNDMMQKNAQNIKRMGFFVIRFFPDAVLIKKPLKGIEFHSSMLDYLGEYKINEEDELQLKPW